MGKEADILAKIVVVEDDVYMREELLNLLEKSGYDTIGLSDFENAVSEIAAYFPDLILLDINLPFRSGFEICKELKAKQIGTVLVLTARDKLQDELHALDLPCDIALSFWGVIFTEIPQAMSIMACCIGYFNTVGR